MESTKNKTDTPFVREPIPWDKFPVWYRRVMIDEMASLRESIGVLRGVVLAPHCTMENRKLAEECIKLEEKLLVGVKILLEGER